MHLGIDLPSLNSDGTYTLPMVTVAVVDATGVIRWIDVAPNHARPTEVAEIISALNAGLDETLTLEVKRELPVKAKNTDVAVDVSAMPLVRLPGGLELHNPSNGELSRALGIGLALAFVPMTGEVNAR